MKIKKYFYFLTSLIVACLVVNAIRIYNYSFVYFENKSDVAIVLGAGTSGGKLSPVFRERVNHGIALYDKKLVGKLIFTGGFGKKQKKSDSQIAKEYAISRGIPEKDIIIEERSKYTIENIIESKKIMDSLDFKSALIVSDPLHMKRAIRLCESYHISCKPSPTKTSMYKSVNTKMMFLLYETLYFSLREPASYLGFE